MEGTLLRNSLTAVCHVLDVAKGMQTLSDTFACHAWLARLGIALKSGDSCKAATTN